MADVTSASSLPGLVAPSAPTSGAPAPSDQSKAAFDMILSAIMSQPPVLAGGGGDSVDDDDDGSSLTVSMWGTPSLG